MTLLVGIKCKDGVVIGSDSAMLFGMMPNHFTISQYTEDKVRVLHDQIIVAGTGHIGLGQRFIFQVAQLYKNGGFSKADNREPVTIGRELSKSAIHDFASTRVPQGQYGALLAFPLKYDSKDEVEMIEFQVSDFQPEVKTEHLWYASMGSGQPIADPLLGLVREAYWKDGVPDVKQGLFAATFVLYLACNMAPGGVSEPINGSD